MLFQEGKNAEKTNQRQSKAVIIFLGDFFGRGKEDSIVMILSGKEIKNQLGKTIFIEPYKESQLNPNSYNLTLHNELLVYTESVLDMKKKNAVQTLLIPPEGLLLQPGILYLGRTNEYTKTESHVPMLEGRSSIGRLGLYIHVTAGFGDVGFAGYWTLEMHCIHPIRIYAGVEICQIFYHTIKGSYDKYKSAKYQNNEGIQASKLYLDFIREQ
jgi:dCTP deaminase